MCCGGSIEGEWEAFSSNGKTWEGVRVCPRCGGVQGIAEQAGFDGVLFQFADGDPQDTNYFDLFILNSKGRQRIHGWYDLRSLKVVQFG